MVGNKKKTILIIAVLLIILGIGGYYSYRKVEAVRNNGVYSIAYVNDIRLAMNGWKIVVTYSYKGINCTGQGLSDIEDFTLKSKGKRFFIKFKEEDPDGMHVLIPILQAPDSIQSAPAEGWNEEWMKRHFPQVVEYVHDTR